MVMKKKMYSIESLIQRMTFREGIDLRGLNWGAAFERDVPDQEGSWSVADLRQLQEAILITCKYIIPYL